MKKNFLFGLLALGLSISSCNKDEAVAPAERLEPQAPVTQETKDPVYSAKEQKEILVSTVDSITKALAVPDLTNVLDFVGSFVAVSEDKVLMETISKVYNDDYRDGYFNPYLLSGLNFVYDYENKTFVESKTNTKDCVIKYLNSQKDTITMSLKLDADSTKFYNDGVINLPASLPFAVSQQIKKTEKKNGKDSTYFVDSVIATININPSVEDLSLFNELTPNSSMGLDCEVNYNKYGVAISNLKVTGSGHSCASIAIKANGNDVITLSAGVDAAVSQHGGDIPFDYVKNGEVSLNLLNKICVTGKLSNLKTIFDLFNEEESSEAALTEDKVKEIAATINKTIAGTQISFDGNGSAQAVFALEPVKVEDESEASKDAWELIPVIKFNDGSMIDLDSFDIEKDEELSKIFEVIENFEKSLDLALEEAEKALSGENKSK